MNYFAYFSGAFWDNAEHDFNEFALYYHLPALSVKSMAMPLFRTNVSGTESYIHPSSASDHSSCPTNSTLPSKGPPCLRLPRGGGDPGGREGLCLRLPRWGGT